jgi:ATP-binding cassette subfamily B protein
MVAHRLTAAVNSNYVIVIDSGAIKEQGTPNDLIAAGGLFKELYDREFAA